MCRKLQLLLIAAVLVGSLVAVPGAAQAIPPSGCANATEWQNTVETWDHGNGYKFDVRAQTWSCTSNDGRYLQAVGELVDTSTNHCCGVIVFWITGLHLDWKDSNGNNPGYKTGINAGNNYWGTGFLHDETYAKWCHSLPNSGYNYQFRANVQWRVQWENGAFSDTHQTPTLTWKYLCR
jgi:hypothetical protein